MNASQQDGAVSVPDDIPAELHDSISRCISDVQESSGHNLCEFATVGMQRATLFRLIASSEFAASRMNRDADWFAEALVTDSFSVATADTNLVAEAERIGSSTDGAASAKAELRQLRHRHLVRILWRSMGDLDDVDQTLAALSLLADTLVIASVRHAKRALEARFGKPMSPDDEEISLLILAMGKLGGRELNFSSDIDLIFLYTEDGETNGPRSLSAHEYFTRLTRQVIALLDDVTEDGFCYRVDTRLRPFGDSGPPVVSFAAVENYLLRHGRGWERYAYVKARPIGSTSADEAIKSLQTTVIEPFVYRRYLDFGVFESLREMKGLIEADVRKRELQNNIKLGPGGIREIEFIAQSLQLVRGGADPKLRCRDLKGALLRCAESNHLAQSSVQSLLESYDFLRKFENALQAVRDQQVHDVPDDFADRARLQVVMREPSWESLSNKLDQHRDSVSNQFFDVAFRGNTNERAKDLTGVFTEYWNRSAGLTEWAELLKQNNFAEPQQLAKSLTEFGAIVVRQKTGATAEKRLARFIPALLLALSDKQHPATVCKRILSVVSGIARRSAYVALLNENPGVLNRLISLCDQSAYLTGEIARFPLLLDELLDPRLYSADISADTMRADLDERLKAADKKDSENLVEILAQFQRATLFRIAVADISGNLPIMKVSDRLTELAEIVLEQALAAAWADLTSRHGLPIVDRENEHRIAGFGVIAYGKLGGIELSYRSDLDLVFLHNSVGSNQQTDGERPLEHSMFFGRLVQRLVHILTVQTGSGALYEVDTRLRPSGRSGLLVVNIEGFERYQYENAWTWEHQALLRSRAVAGNAAVAREFEKIRANTLCSRVHVDDLREKVMTMRQKMRTQLDRSGAKVFDLKQGEGGIGDIEFLVQYLVLKNASHHPELIHYSDNIRQLETLEAIGILDVAEVARLQDAYKAYRLRVHRLSLDGEPPLVPIETFADERAFVSSVWQREVSGQETSQEST